MSNQVKMINDDCVAAMRALADHSIDAVVTDPPYAQTNLAWDQWSSEWINEVDRVLKPRGSMWVFGTLRMFASNWSDFDNWTMAQDIVWEKHNGSGPANDRFRRVHELAVQFYRGAWRDVWKGKVYTMDARRRTIRRKSQPPHLGKIGSSTFVSREGGPRIMRSVIYARSQHGNAIHPTQKPEAIIEPLILNCCPPGGTVLDPFAGSGTTGFVAQRLGRNSILIERDESYFSEMQKRFSQDLLNQSVVLVEN